LTVIAFADKLFSALKLTALTFPVTVTAPNVVEPPDTVEVKVPNHPAAFVVPSERKYLKVPEFVSNHNWTAQTDSVHAIRKIFHHMNKVCV